MVGLIRGEETSVQEDVRSDAGDRGAGQIQGRKEGEIKVGQESVGSDD